MGDTEATMPTTTAEMADRMVLIVCEEKNVNHKKKTRA